MAKLCQVCHSYVSSREAGVLSIHIFMHIYIFMCVLIHLRTGSVWQYKDYTLKKLHFPKNFVILFLRDDVFIYIYGGVCGESGCT